MNDWNINEPWFEDDKFIPYLLEKISLIDIIDKCELKYTRVSSGNFIAKMTCPFHLDGQERTASLYASNTRFHCFACNVDGNAIDFLCLLKGMPYYRAIELLAKAYGLVDINEKELEDFVVAEKIPIEQTITPYIFQTGIIIREHLKNITNGSRTKWEKWAEKEFRRLDYFVENYSDKKWERVKENQEKVMKIIQEGKI